MDKKTTYMCPKCHSIDWKTPDSLNPIATSGAGIVMNNIWECKNCGHIGMFFEVDVDQLEKIRKEFKNQNYKHQES